MSIKGEDKVSKQWVSVDIKSKGSFMRNNIVAIAIAAMCSGTALADTTPAPPPPATQQPNYGCPGPEYQQFKFWIGEWNVTSTKGGKQAGESKIELLDAGCVIFENWKGASGGTGHSLNVYDQADGKWHQTWIDATGDQVHYIGEFKNGKMEFRADDIATPQKQKMILTMTFEPRADGTVRQSGTQSTDGGKTFAPAFDLIYTRKK
jgi:hypothetical protein